MKKYISPPTMSPTTVALTTLVSHWFAIAIKCRIPTAAKALANMNANSCFRLN